MKRQKVWESKKYYELAHDASCDMDHPAMKHLSDLAKNAENILDLGCGEGTRLVNLKIKKKGKKTGIDISKFAIKSAKNRHKEAKFILGDLEDLPFNDNEFDLLYSAYVLEHTINPERILKEAIRVLKPEGKLLIVAPNFGAPNRASPPAKYNRIRKLLLGFINDHIFPSVELSWVKVEPIKGKYFPDSDTTIEPYLLTLKRYLKKNLKMKIVIYSSLWSEEMRGAKLHQKIFGFLGKIGFYPFSYWGPHLLIVCEK